MNQQVSVHVQSLDPRLRLAACDRPLSATIAGDGQPRVHSMVKVLCEGNVHWTIYLSVDIESDFKVLVARHALSRDAELSDRDFELAARHLPGLTTDYVTDASMLTGQRLRQSIASGEALSLAVPHSHQRDSSGSRRSPWSRAPKGFQVRMNAIALSDGRLSERIRVQNLSSQRIVEGVVRSDSVVEVPL